MSIIQEIEWYKGDNMNKSAILLLLISIILLANLQGLAQCSHSDQFGNYFRIEKNDKDVLEASSISQHVTGNITLDSNEEYANVGPGGIGIVSFQGKVTVDVIGVGQNVQLVTVQLTVDVKDLEYSISPNTMTWTPSETGTSKPFSLSVEVPFFTSSSEEFKVTVDGSAKPIPGTQTYTLESAKGVIKIWQYSIIGISPKIINYTLSKGDSREIEITLHNYGNGPDEVKLGIIKESEFKNSGIVFSYEEKWIKIPEGGQKDTILLMYVNTNATDREVRIEFYTESRAITNPSDQGMSWGGYINLIVKSEEVFFTRNNLIKYGLVIFSILLLIIISGYLIIKKRGKKK